MRLYDVIELWWFWVEVAERVGVCFILTHRPGCTSINVATIFVVESAIFLFLKIRLLSSPMRLWLTFLNEQNYPQNHPFSTQNTEN